MKELEEELDQPRVRREELVEQHVVLDVRELGEEVDHCQGQQVEYVHEVVGRHPLHGEWPAGKKAN